MPPRLSDVAARAGVSEATVSRVLNGKAGVARSTRRAVLQAADAVGYQRNRTAADSARVTVGVIVPELENPVFATFAQELTLLLATAGHTPLLGTQRLGGVGEDEWIEMLLSRGAGGLIVVSGMHADTESSVARYERLRELNVPLVLINGYRADVDALFLSTDDRSAIEQSLNHLASLGHRRVGLAIGPPRYVPVIRKVEAFLSHDSPGGDMADRFVEHSLFTVEGGYAAAQSLLDQSVTAMITGSDVMALGAIRACVQRGLSVPDDVSVVGFDDSLFASFTSPALTTVRQPSSDISREAASMLHDELAGSPAAHREYIFRPELMVRASTAMAHDIRPDHLRSVATPPA